MRIILNSYSYLAGFPFVEEALIKEAKKRGFKKGVRIGAHACDSFGDASLNIEDNTRNYYEDENSLELDCAIVFSKGKWTTINTEPQIEITVKINGKESKLSDISEDTLKKLRNVH